MGISKVMNIVGIKHMSACKLMYISCVDDLISRVCLTRTYNKMKFPIIQVRILVLVVKIKKEHVQHTNEMKNLV